ncbi:MAG: long-chain fatty acid--CoA ligase, partial [Chromatocurvus sp.]
MRTSASRVPDKEAVVCGDRTLLYRQLVERTNRVANAARNGLGLEAGDRVALVTPNRLEYFELVLGLSDVGAIAVTVNPGSSPSELTAILADCSARYVFIDPALENLIEAVSGSDIPHIAFGSSYDDWLSQASDVHVTTPVPEWASFCICYTSGTTGRPKGVQLPHRSRVLTALATAVEYNCFGMDDRFLAIAPLFHGAGFAFAMAAVAFGGCCVLHERFDAEALAECLQSGGITGVFMVPTHFTRLFDLPGNLLPTPRATRGLRTIISNAAALPPPMKETAVGRFGAGVLHETYGSTEAGIVTNMRPDHILRLPESVGTPFIATEVEIRRENGEVCAPGEIGELFSRGPYTFNGYLNRPEETASTLV